MISGLPENDAERFLLESAFNEWAPQAKVALQSLTPGHSGSALFKADLKQVTTGVASGVHIVKTSPPPQWHDQIPEFQAHQRAWERNPDFSAAHIPSLIAHYPADEAQISQIGYAMLLEVAGRSLDRFVPADDRQDGSFAKCAKEILHDLLGAWADLEPNTEMTPAELLRSLCGYRLNRDEAPQLHELIQEVSPEPHFVVAGEVLVNPLHFISLADEHLLPSFPILSGLVHGDLHGGNIMLHRLQPDEHPFFVIDFALSHNGAIGYDAAYLELSHVLAALGDFDPTFVIGAVRAAEDPLDRNPTPGDTFWARSLIATMRSALSEWRDKAHIYRTDEIDRQLTLARIAVGLNWANKPIKRSWQIAAIAYAGWAARQYLRNHAPKLWTQFDTAKKKSVSVRADDDLWNEIWQATHGFDGSRGKFILVSERIKPDASLRALGQLPWSAIIDLDPQSDKDGLHRHAEGLLRVRRAVHLFTSQQPLFDVQRGTGWLLAGGWAAKGELYPDFHEWRWARLPVVREFMHRIAASTSPEPLNVLVLPGATLDQAAPGARLASIMEVIDEESRGRAVFQVLGSRNLPANVKQISNIPLQPTSFVQRVAIAFGTAFSARASQVPGPTPQMRTISPDLLRAMQENMHVLHSSILDEQPDPVAGLASEFWRGRPPTWSELHAGVDIPRKLNTDLVRVLREKLDAHRNQTVVLEHGPGAGGTTAALRAAWDLKDQYPVAVLHKYSDALQERVRELFQVAERPVLLVAEASDLPDSAREELYRYLSQNNCRVVLLYLRRTFVAQAGREETSLNGPMEKSEAKSFCQAYSELSADDRKKKELKRIANDKSLEQYRLPFFFGLIAFEREFVGIERYVDNHLSNTGKAIKQVLEHLALVTIYSNGGISLALLKALLGIDPRVEMPLTDLVGEGPAGLLIERAGGIRFMHQIIAEQVMRYLQGSGAENWRLDLKFYAMDFIRDTVAAAGSEAMRTIFRQMFVDRMGSGDGAEDREDFSPIIESLDALDTSLGHAVLEFLASECPEESHFWSHLGRHQIFRLRRDYDRAEEYLCRAISLNPNDPIHHHTFGLILRHRLWHELKALPKDADLASVFGAFDPLFGRAASEFEETRRLSPDNVYGYITNIQLIVSAALRLKDTVGEDTIARVGLDHAGIVDWLNENLPLAEQLLREATHLYGTLEVSNQYLVRCEADLDQLYGDIDNVIERWEVANAAGKTGTRGRRALANAFLVRNNRRWTGLGLPVLRRIVSLMEENLRDGERRDDDYYLWFNSYVRLPNFDADEALSQLALWIKRFPSWRAHYYQYVLRYVLWYSGRSGDIKEFEQALEECKRRHVGRGHSSSLWYGASANGSGLVSDDDLGSWKSDLNFFTSPDALRPVNGIIERINGPQAGTVLIGGRVRAFFVPGRIASAHRNENERVHFFVGFSPEGLRAWAIEAGHVDGADRAGSNMNQPGAEAVEIHEKEKKPAFKSRQAKASKRARAIQFGVELVRAKARIGASLSNNELVARIDSLLGMDNAAAELGIVDLAGEVVAAGGFALRDKSGLSSIGLANPDPESELPAPHDALERRHGYITSYFADRAFGFIAERGTSEEYWFHKDFVLPNFRSAIAENAIVTFTPGNNEKGKIGRGISVVDGVVLTADGVLPEDKLEDSLSQFVYAKVAGCSLDGISLERLSTSIRSSFYPRARLDEKLGKKLDTFIAAIDGLEINRRTGRVVLAKQPVFGRLVEKSDRKHGAAKARKTGVAAPDTQTPLTAAKRSESDRKSANESGANNIGKAIQIVDNKGNSVSTEFIKKDIVNCIFMAQEAGRNMKLAQLGYYLVKKYPEGDLVHKQLGYPSLKLLLEDISTVEIGPHPHGELSVHKNKK